MPDDSPTIHHTEHHGIPIVWADLSGPLTGKLIFGVGMRDEPPPLMGITHLTEHLLFRSLGSDVDRAHDGITSGSTVQFFVTGPPSDVGSFLNDLAASITTPPFDEPDVLLERRVIETERPHAFGPNAGLLTFRYGIGSIGNAHAGAPTLAAISIDEVRDWIRSWMVTGNARLVFSGPPPQNLDLRLPDGTIPDRRRSEGALLSKPTLVECEKLGVALSLVAAESTSPFLCDALQFELTKELRHRRGLIYSVDTEVTAVEPGLDQVDFVLDPLDEDVPEVIAQSVATVRRLAREGFGETAVSASRTTCLNAMAYPDAWRAELDNLAITALIGGFEMSVNEYIQQAQKLNADDLTAVLNDAMHTLVVAYDEDVELPEDLAEKHGLEVDPFSYWESNDDVPKAEGRSWRGRGDLSIRDRAAFHGDVLLVRLLGEWGRVRLADVAVVGEHSDGMLSLIDIRGRHFLFDPVDWWRGGSLRKAILDQVPTQARRDFSWHGNDRPERPDVDLA